MKRRTFLAGIGSAAITSPFAARAQPSGKIRRVGLLIFYREDDVEGQLRARAFRAGLEERGWVIGGNLQVDIHWGVGDVHWIQSEVAEMLKRSPDVILANSDQGAKAALPASQIVPTVFIGGSDPVAQGFVQSLARPGGNMTGFSALQPGLGPKWIELLKDIAPQVTHVTVFINPENSGSMVMVKSIASAAQKLGVETAAGTARAVPEIESAMETVASRPNGGLIVPADPSVAFHRKLIVELAARNRLPAVYALRSFAVDGGLASYGVSFPAIFGQAAEYVDRILRGEKPADLPVQRPTTFEFAINLRAAKRIGIEPSPQLLALANELIE